VGAREASLWGFVEASVKYHSWLIAALTRIREPERGQGQAGSLTGAVASQRVTEASNGFLRVDGHHPQRVERQKGA
jgi:hypothetical protein